MPRYSRRWALIRGYNVGLVKVACMMHVNVQYLVPVQNCPKVAQKNCIVENFLDICTIHYIYTCTFTCTMAIYNYMASILCALGGESECTD